MIYVVIAQSVELGCEQAVLFERIGNQTAVIDNIDACDYADEDGYNTAFLLAVGDDLLANNGLEPDAVRIYSRLPNGKLYPHEISLI